MVAQTKTQKARFHASLNLNTHQGGAIMVSGIFISAFLVGALYMLIGASTAMQHGEKMQDGADAAAFTVAQTHAKAMNLIALDNMFKVAAITMLSSHAAVQEGANNDATFAQAYTEMCGYTPCQPLSWTVPIIQSVENQAKSKMQTAKQILPDAIDAAHKMQETFRDDLHSLAEDIVNQAIKPVYSSPIKAFFLSPLKKMPIEEEDDSKMCQRVMPYATPIIVSAFQTVPHTSPDVNLLGILFSLGHWQHFCDDYTKPAFIPKDEDEAKPGKEAYQIRAYSIGEKLTTAGQNGVQVATWGKSPENNSLKKLRDNLSKIAFAQAEYFHSGSTQLDEALWSMNWRARLRHFRPKGNIASDCSRKGGSSQSCNALQQKFSTMKWAIAH